MTPQSWRKLGVLVERTKLPQGGTRYYISQGGRTIGTAYSRCEVDHLIEVWRNSQGTTGGLTPGAQVD